MREQGNHLEISHEHVSRGSVVIVAKMTGHSPTECQVRRFPIKRFEPRILANYADFDVVKPFIRFVLQRNPKKVFFRSLCTETADLLRMLLAMDIPSYFIGEPESLIFGDTEHDQRWGAALEQRIASSLSSSVSLLDRSPAPAPVKNSYELYAFSARSHPLLILWVERVLRFFANCKDVLDIGCGTGVFLDQVARRGITAIGIDSNEASVKYARLLGLDAVFATANVYLAKYTDRFDGIHCSHLIEHLDFEDLSDFIPLVANALKPGGKVVFVMPDPESIRSQLLGFWRDPDHVRFYHPEIIELISAKCGLEFEYNSQNQPDRQISSFSMYPPEDSGEDADLWSDDGKLSTLAVIKRLELHERWIRQLWAVNQTWAWADDALLVLRKPEM